MNGMVSASEQPVNQLLFPLHPATLGGNDCSFLSLDQGLSWNSRPRRIVNAAPQQSVELPNHESPSLATHLSRAQNALRQIADGQRRAEKRKLHMAESHWLTQNRKKFAGKWIALMGTELLAVGDTAKDVFAQVADLSAPPLVIRIDPVDLPFGGW